LLVVSVESMMMHALANPKKKKIYLASAEDETLDRSSLG
jgi:hypothetical protein